MTPCHRGVRASSQTRTLVSRGGMSRSHAGATADSGRPEAGAAVAAEKDAQPGTFQILD